MFGGAEGGCGFGGVGGCLGFAVPVEVVAYSYGENAGEANVNGKRIGKVMSWAASPLFADSPMMANPHDRAYAKNSSGVIAHANR